MIGISEGKETGEITVCCSTTYFYISKPTNAVFLLQLHVHHVGLVVFHLSSEKLTLFTISLVGFYFLDCIGGQVFEH